MIRDRDIPWVLPIGGVLRNLSTAIEKSCFGDLPPARIILPWSPEKDRPPAPPTTRKMSGFAEMIGSNAGR